MPWDEDTVEFPDPVCLCGDLQTRHHRAYYIDERKQVRWHLTTCHVEGCECTEFHMESPGEARRV